MQFKKLETTTDRQLWALSSLIGYLQVKPWLQVVSEFAAKYLWQIHARVGSLVEFPSNRLS